MSSRVCLVCLLVFFVSVCDAAKGPQVFPLPSYLKKACSRNDPNINKCVVEVGAPAIKVVTNGDPKYKIPKLDPLKVSAIKIQQGTRQVGLNLVCNDCLMWGLQNTVFYKADVDFPNRMCTWYFTLDKMRITGKYNVSGQVLLLPITGHGNMEMLLDDLKFSYLYDWTFREKSNGRTYVVIGNSTLPFEVGNMKITLENLFNGDKLLGGNMNRFINENWKEIMKDLSPAFSKSLASIFKTVLQNMANVVPFDIMFPEKYPVT
ncbi:protein takeout-like [Cimex lectularius]|uniref:Takeout n=1 Tax=Cimex lectularius TaxID=79782 RepID=A0A8I6S291_CIMLE|nr:protein takeout-like [Cimex lectularius]